jgi:hypothetical protein
MSVQGSLLVDSDHRCPFPAGWSIAASPHSATNILDDNTANIPNRPPLFSEKKNIDSDEFRCVGTKTATASHWKMFLPGFKVDFLFGRIVHFIS